MIHLHAGTAIANRLDLIGAAVDEGMADDDLGGIGALLLEHIQLFEAGIADTRSQSGTVSVLIAHPMAFCARPAPRMARSSNSPIRRPSRAIGLGRGFTLSIPVAILMMPARMEVCMPANTIPSVISRTKKSANSSTLCSRHRIGKLEVLRKETGGAHVRTGSLRDIHHQLRVTADFRRREIDQRLEPRSRTAAPSSVEIESSSKADRMRTDDRARHPDRGIEQMLVGKGAPQRCGRNIAQDRAHLE